jgi:hypothetical protein
MICSNRIFRGLRFPCFSVEALLGPEVPCPHRVQFSSKYFKLVYERPNCRLAQFQASDDEKGHMRRLLGLLQQRRAVQADAMKSAMSSAPGGPCAVKAAALFATPPTLSEIESERREAQAEVCRLPRLAQPVLQADELERMLSNAGCLEGEEPDLVMLMAIET